MALMLANISLMNFSDGWEFCETVSCVHVNVIMLLLPVIGSGCEPARNSELDLRSDAANVATSWMPSLSLAASLSQLTDRLELPSLSVMWLNSATQQHVQCVRGHSVQPLPNYFGLLSYFIVEPSVTGVEYIIWMYCF